MKTSEVALDALLRESWISVQPGFRDRVMAALPRAAWERRLGDRRLPAWALPAGMATALALGAVLAVAWGGASAADSHALGIAAAVFDFFATTTLAGAGLLYATWRGASMGFAELFAGSPLSLLALVAGVVCLDLLFLALLRRRKRAVPETAAREPGGRQPPGC